MTWKPLTWWKSQEDLKLRRLREAGRSSRRGGLGTCGHSAPVDIRHVSKRAHVSMSFQSPQEEQESHLKCNVSQVFQVRNYFFFFGSTAAAKWLQSCPTLCDPINGSPPGSPILGILQARTLEWVAIAFSNA